MSLKWGIASSGKICHDFVEALKCLPKGEHEVVAVAARSQKSADDFAKEHSIKKAYEGYKALALDKDVDVVYVGVVNPAHLEVCKIMLEHKKHVLCEKPLAMNQREAQETIDCAKKNKVFFMEALWSRFFPVYTELRKQLESGAIGDVLYVYVSFGTLIHSVDRVSKKELGGGTILDIGIYILQLQQFVFKGLKPIKVVGNGHLNENGVDESANAVITYPDGKTAVVSCNSRVRLPNEAVITGSKGTIRIVAPFWCPTTIISNEKTLNFDLPASTSTYNFSNSRGLAYEADHVRDCIQKGLLESPVVPHSDSLELSYLMDTIRKDIGVVYDQDK